MRREAGVGLAIANSIARNLTTFPKAISDRLMILKIKINDKTPLHLHIISAYAPTLPSSEDSKQQFYEDLSRLLRGIPLHDKVICLGDFNARVGSDNTTWAGALGSFGRGNINSNGVMLLSFCKEFHLWQSPTHSSICQTNGSTPGNTLVLNPGTF